MKLMCSKKGGRTDFDVLVYSFDSTDYLTVIFAVPKARPSMSFQDAEEFIKVLPKTLPSDRSFKKNAKQARRILYNGGLNVIILLIYGN
jgi:hypothetical protein